MKKVLKTEILNHAQQLAQEMNLRMLPEWEVGGEILFVESVTVTSIRYPVRKQAGKKKR